LINMVKYLMNLGKLSRREIEEASTVKERIVKYFNSLIDTCIVVEGQSDLEELRKLNINIPIYVCNSPNFKSIYNKGSFKRIVILTDWDRKGIVLYKNLKRRFESLGFVIDEYSRELFRNTTKRFGIAVEEICRNIQRRCYM